MPLIWTDDLERWVPPDDPDNWIDLKRELSAGDDDEVWETVTKVSADAAEDVKVSIRVTALNRGRVERSIVAWSYTHDGQPVPVTPETIGRLDRATYAALIEKVDELNPLVIPPTRSTNGAGSKPGMPASRQQRRRA